MQKKKLIKQTCLHKGFDTNQQHQAPLTQISPSKFLQAVHLSRRMKQQQQQQKNLELLAQQQQHHYHNNNNHYNHLQIYNQQHTNIQIPNMQRYASVRQLAYEKLKRQAQMEANVRENFGVEYLPSNTDYAAVDTQQQQQLSSKLKSEGRLKLAIYANMQTHLTVHIIEAKGLGGSGGRGGLGGSEATSRSRSSSSSTVMKKENVEVLDKKKNNNNISAYVKITQMPDEGERGTVVKTRVVEASNATTTCIAQQRFIFDDKFSFEICQLNANNRLVISLWTISGPKQRMWKIFLFKINLNTFLLLLKSCLFYF